MPVLTCTQGQLQGQFHMNVRFKSTIGGNIGFDVELHKCVTELICVTKKVSNTTASTFQKYLIKLSQAKGHL